MTTAVVGAGVVGLAVARALARAGREVVVLEALPAIGTVTSARNSEVIHAGVYYAEGTLKARACVAGRRMLYDFCDAHGVGYKRCGKLIVATNPAQHEALCEIKARSVANGLVSEDEALVELSAAEAQALEPELSCTAALLSPSTGVLDSHAYMLALQGDAEEAGAVVAFNSPVVGAKPLEGGQGGATLHVGGEAPMSLECREVVNCAGLAAPALTAGLLGRRRQGGGSAAATAEPAYRGYYAKGNYYRLQSVRAPFRHLVYPVPEADGAGLGVHITVDIGGQARFGPDVEWLEERPPDAPPPDDYTVDPARSAGFYDAVRRYWPGLPDEALAPDYAGIRPKLRGASSSAADEFVLLGPGAGRVADGGHGARAGVPAGVLHMLGIESPGLTASLALGEMALKVLDGPEAASASR